MSSDVLSYLCPICGFLLPYPPRDFNICPSCGTEFDADTVEYSIDELRQAWFDRGLTWTSAVITQPAHFDPIEQLGRLDAQAATGQTTGEKEIGTSQEPVKFGPKSAMSIGRVEWRIA